MKKELIVFNKSDLLDEEKIFEKIKNFKKKIKKKYEIISVFNEKDLKKIKQILVKNVS